jgi:serine/threonine protein kinase/regulation of enolase protein 1 (concanavalin A-like superfamily)
MFPTDRDRATSPLPSPNGLGAAEGPEATISYIFGAGPPLGSVMAGGPTAGPRRFDFLGPPRAEGELGWLAHYRVRSLVGEGGLGLVFLAEDTQLSRPVALKVIRPELAGAPGVLSRFEREAQATAAVKHDHIVTIYQVGRERDVSFLAMEYLRGISLDRWLEQGHRPTVGQVLRVGREIAAGLAAAHGRGLVHRDIKPANIWLEAPTGRVKILDFGLARSEHDDARVTQAGTILGTPEYMSPEQARGEPPGMVSDLFSLGSVLYRVCAGRLPFPGTTIMAVLSALSRGNPRPLRDVVPGMPPALDDLVMRLLARDPADRPASALAVVEAITAIERQVQAERQRARRPEVSRQPGVAEASERTELDIAGGADQPRPPSRPRIGRRTRWIAAAALGTAAAAAAWGVVPPRKGTPRIVALQPTTVPAPDDRAGGRNGTTTPDVPRQARPVAVPDRLGTGEGRGTMAGKVPTTAPESPPTARPGPGHPSGPTAGEAPREVVRGDDRPSRKAPGEKGSSHDRPQAARGVIDWGGLIDPDGDCRIDLDPSGHRIRIVVPGTPHILSAELGRMNAPRLDRDARGDFEARVRVAGVFHPAGRATVQEYAPYHGAGLLVWQDAENYVRLEIAADLWHGKRRPYVNFEYRKDGALAVSRGMLIGEDASQLRLRRRGDEIFAAFGPDGARWTSFPVLAANLKGRLKVGVVAINSATKSLTARLDDFEVTAPPRGGDKPLDP